MNRQKALKAAANTANARRFPTRSRMARKAARKARVAVREALWIAEYDRLEHAAGHQGINSPPAVPMKRRKKDSKIGSEARRRSPHRSGRPKSARGRRPAATPSSRTEAPSCG